MNTLLKIFLACACCTLPGARAAGSNAAPAVAEQPLRDPFTLPFVPPPTTPVVATNAAVVAQAPAAPVAAPVAPAPARDVAAELRKALHVQGFVQQGGRNLAMINGRLVSTGDVIQVRLEKVTQRFRVTSVTATTVNFELLP